jgi:hypothetical protein
MKQRIVSLLTALRRSSCRQITPQSRPHGSAQPLYGWATLRCSVRDVAQLRMPRDKFPAMSTVANQVFREFHTSRTKFYYIPVLCISTSICFISQIFHVIWVGYRFVFKVKYLRQELTACLSNLANYCWFSGNCRTDSSVLWNMTQRKNTE